MCAKEGGRGHREKAQMRARKPEYSREEPNTKSEMWSLLLRKMAKSVRKVEGEEGAETTKILREMVLSIAALKVCRFLGNVRKRG